jgi:hypothetical protein
MGILRRLPLVAEHRQDLGAGGDAAPGPTAAPPSARPPRRPGGAVHRAPRARTVGAAGRSTRPAGVRSTGWPRWAIWRSTGMAASSTWDLVPIGWKIPTGRGPRQSRGGVSPRTAAARRRGGASGLLAQLPVIPAKGQIPPPTNQTRGWSKRADAGPGVSHHDRWCRGSEGACRGPRGGMADRGDPVRADPVPGQRTGPACCAAGGRPPFERRPRGRSATPEEDRLPARRCAGSQDRRCREPLAPGISSLSR